MSSMQWEEALAAVSRIEARSALDAHTLSYRYLFDGPALLAQRERMLRRSVSLLPEGTELPTPLSCDLFAWAKAMAMAQRRLPWDLPQSWSGTESGAA
jgi:hypothetical protein